jgi:hypothetical protein
MHNFSAAIFIFSDNERNNFVDRSDVALGISAFPYNSRQ